MLTVVLLCLLVCMAYAVREQIKARSTYKLPPSLPGELPVIGHALVILSGSKDIWSLIERVSQCTVQEGGVTYWRFFHDLYYIITDAEDALTVANSCLQKGSFYEFGNNWVGQGLFTGPGDINKLHRKLLGPRFTAPTAHTFMKLFNDHARKLVDEVKSYRGKAPFDPSTIIKHIVLQTSCLTTFGSNIKDVNFIKNYSVAVDEIMEMYISKFTKPYLQSSLIYKLLGHHRREDLLVNDLTELTSKVIQSKKAAIQNNDVDGNHPDLINHNQDTYRSLADYMLELGGLLTDKEIKEELDTNIIASYDTISHTLINMLVLVGSHPEVQDKIYKELIEVLGADRDVDKNDLQKLVYTKAVIKETLRVLPTAPLFARYVHRDVTLKNYTVPAKSHCMILPYGIHRSPAWGPDAELFRPERWLDPASLPSDTNSFAAFSMGKRSCTGMTYGITQLTVTLAHLVRHTKWTTDCARLKLQWSLTLQSTGHEISFERRTARE